MPTQENVQAGIPVEVILLDKIKCTSLASQKFLHDCPGEYQSTFASTTKPESAPADQQVPEMTEDSERKPSAVFLPDDRYIYTDTNYPWSLVGRVRTATGAVGSGAVVGPRHVLTASHVVDWTRDANGSVGAAWFTPAYYDGRGPWGEFTVRQVYSWRENSPARLSDSQTAFDYAILVLHDTISDKVGGFAGARVYDAQWNGQALWQTLGYPVDLNNGERPAFQGGCIISTKEDHMFDVGGGRINGAVLGHFNDIFGGQSGGPVWRTFEGEKFPRVVGVQSTESSTPQLGSTTGDNEYGGGQALFDLVDWVKTNVP
ncbi:hypothetical protein M501DRAFT_1015142 [Patellaria atrata CBS 101060]|uniref:Serine protease n=1 Tax=Patellaria atrata CBS 101060 TaxID=1346257 RepID=A0A9P4VTY6_9PEZI|nr:hypothetical protein M501DRAFT_1015142 [Patellaria atrata CBS 101060]